MVFSYGISVILLSFALFGGWCFAQEMWHWLIEPRLFRKPKISFLILVQDAEQEIEEMVRHLMQEIENSAMLCEVIFLDCGSTDLTGPMLGRLAKEFQPWLTLYTGNSPQEIADALPYCTGEIIQLIDTINRLPTKDFIPVIGWLLSTKDHNL